MEFKQLDDNLTKMSLSDQIDLIEKQAADCDYSSGSESNSVVKIKNMIDVIQQKIAEYIELLDSMDFTKDAKLPDFFADTDKLNKLNKSYLAELDTLANSNDSLNNDFNNNSSTESKIIIDKKFDEDFDENFDENFDVNFDGVDQS